MNVLTVTSWEDLQALLRVNITLNVTSWEDLQALLRVNITLTVTFWEDLQTLLHLNILFDCNILGRSAGITAPDYFILTVTS